MPVEERTLVGSRLAFFNGTSLIAREIRSLLEARSHLVADVRLFDESEAGTVSEFAGEALVVTAPDEESILDLDVGFMCGTAAQTTRYLDWAERRRFTAIDLSGAASVRSGVPVIHTEVNPGDLSGSASPPPIVAAPHAVAHNLAALLAAAGELAGIRSVQVTALLPASEAGEPGIDELYRQTLGLLNFAEVPHETFGRQLAFNVLDGGGDRGRLTERLMRETSQITGIPQEAMRLLPACVPLFHGHVISAAVGFDGPVEVQALKGAIGARRGLKLIDDPSIFSPVELSGDEGIAVMVPGSQPPRSTCLALWSVCDNLKDGAALNATRIAERVLDLRKGRA